MGISKLCIDLLHEHTENRISKLARHIEVAGRLDAEENAAAIYMELGEIARHTELLSKELRMILSELHASFEALGLSPEYVPLAISSDVKTSVKNEIYTIRLDGILPFKSKGNVYYLHEKLDAALELFLSDSGISAPVFGERCAVIIRHHYDMERSSGRQIRDYDNLETSCVLNVIARYFMWDDDPKSYLLMQDIAPDHSDFTEIIVMKSNELTKWLAGNLGTAKHQ